MLLNRVLRKTNTVRNLLKMRFSENLPKKNNESRLSNAQKAFQFRKDELIDFGELPRGEIPDALKIDPKFDLVNLPNAAKIGVEHYNSNHAGNVGFKGL